MKQVHIADWLIEFDRDATEAAYESIPLGGPETCGCSTCLNWAFSRDQLFPGAFKEFLQQLGIPFDREREVYHCARLQNGLHWYGAWYHFAGRVLQGELESVPYLKFGAFSVFFQSKPALLLAAFAGMSVAQLELTAEVPWLSAIPEAS